MRHPSHRQSGAIAVMATLFIVILIGIAALALDLGRLYVLRTEMQNAVDAAAMAAAAELDYQDHAIHDAKVAAREAFLSHKGRFAQKQELLSILGDDAFEFYSWIGAELDGPRPCPSPSSSPEEPNKCPTVEDDEAAYVKVKLYPELVEDGHYRISLFFLPVLSILLDDGVSLEASTKVSAVAGAGGPMLCNLPPMMVCDPAETGDPMVPGQMVVLKEQGSGAWQPGNFGFLQPFTPITGNLNKDLSLQMANEDLGGCIRPSISTLSGGKSSYGRYGLNTRFGIYDHSIEDYKDQAPPAPNVVDYPRDDNLTQPADLSPNSCRFDIDEKFGTNKSEYAGTQGFSGAPYNGLLTTEVPSCAASFGLSSNPSGLADADGDNWHSGGAPVNSIDPDDADNTNPGHPPPFYNEAYHEGESVPTFSSRYEYYQWELGVDSVDPDPNNWQWAMDPAYVDNPNKRLPSLSNATLLASVTEDEDACLNDEGCRILDGDPASSMPAAGDPGLPNRRIIYVAMLNCLDLGITGNTPDIPIPETGKFAKFFLTEHAYPPPAVDYYVEFLGEVESEERNQIIIKNQIQLYE